MLTFQLRGVGDTESHSFFSIYNGGNIYATSKVTAILAAVLMVTVCSVALISSESEGVAPGASPVTDASELQSAFQNGGSYYLANNIDLGTIGDEETEDGPVLILDVGKTLTLDLNGNDLTADITTVGDDVYNKYSKIQIIRNQGNLTITDTAGGGSINNTGENSFDCTRTIFNAEGATLTFNGGTIGSAEAVALLNNGYCEITDTTFIASNDSHSGGWNNACAAIENRGNGTLVINSGTFTSVSESAIFADGDAMAIIYGGTFSGDESYGFVNGDSADTNVVIYGGTFSSDPSIMVPQTHYVVTSGSSYMVQVRGEGTSYVSSFDQLADIIAEVEETQYYTVHITGEVTVEGGIIIPENVEIVVDEGSTFSIPDGSTVDLKNSIINNGTLVLDGFINNNNSITNNGTIEGVPVVNGGSYIVDSPMSLQWLSKLVNDNSGSTWDVSVTEDITIPDGFMFESIGYANGVVFTGTFDGNGHTISGLRSVTNSASYGMFYALGDAMIRDVTLDVDYETRTGFIGGIADVAIEGTTFLNVTVEGEISATGTSYGVGGMVASVSSISGGDVYFINCKNAADIGGTNAYNIGPIFGSAENLKSSIYIYNCSNTGAIVAKGSAGNVYGFGHLDASATLEIMGFTVGGTCTINGTSSDKISTANGTGYTYITDHWTTTAVVGSDGEWTYIGSETVSVDSIVAESDGIKYAGLSAALSNAYPSSVVELTANVSEDVSAEVSGTITLVGGSYSVTGSFQVTGGPLYIISGTYNADVSEYVADGYIQSNGVVSVRSDVPTIEQSATGETTVVELPVGQDTVVSNGAMDDAQVTTTQNDGYQLTYEGSLNVGNVTMTAESIVADSKVTAEIQDIMGNPNLSLIGGVNVEVAGAAVVNGYSLTVRMALTVPDGYTYVQGTLSVIYYESGVYEVFSDIVVDGGYIYFTTSHNSNYYLTAELITDDTADPSPGWTDDDELLPPVFNVPEDKTDNTTIVACAAAAVVAALMAVFLTLDRKK